MKYSGYIAIEGPIGVGKTVLAKKLAQDFPANLALEQVDDNPFLDKFYEDPEKFALSTQLYFLTNRVKQIQLFKQTDMFNTARISDFLMEKDRLFAELTLEPTEFDLYETVYASLTRDLLVPDLVIYLQAPLEVLISRIHKRGRHFERLIEADYLEKVSTMYSEFFYHYHAAPLLIINVSEVDFVANSEDYSQLLERIKVMNTGRHYYNPVSMNTQLMTP